MSNRAEAIRADRDLLRQWELPDPGDSKNSRGTVMLIGGSRLSAGALVLAGEAALRVGAGKVAVIADAAVADVARIALPEAGAYDAPTSEGETDAAWRTACEDADAVLVGPGLDDLDQAREWLDRLARFELGCLVVDAFAVAALREAPRSRLPQKLIVNANLDEVAVLLGRPIDDLVDDLSQLSRELDAVVHGYSAVAAPTGEVWEIEGGGPGLGTAGSGDALAGAITGFAARGLPAERAAVWGSWCHARAGDRLTQRLGLGFLAREVVRELPLSLLEVSAPAEGTETRRRSP